MKKIAVILFNLGGPDKPESVKPFLFNLFNDKAIIGAPGPIRWGIAKLISTRRAPVAREIYEHLGGKSPLLELTLAQAKQLEDRLNGVATENVLQAEQSSLAGEARPSNRHPRAGGNPEPQEGPNRTALDPRLRGDDESAAEYKIFPCMRYWHPMADEVVKDVKAWGADEILLMTLYPQFSTTTTGSSLEDWHKTAKKHGLDLPTTTVGCYPWQEDFVESHATLLRDAYIKSSKKGTPRILFSAHGLPKKIIEKGDPYQWQVEQTTKAVVARFLEKMELDAVDHVVCYQSKVGPLEWIKPSTDDEIVRACKDGAPIILTPIAFVSEHSETLVELDIEYREMADEHGCIGYERVAALGTQPNYIDALEKMCRNAAPGSTSSDEGKRLCPPEFTQCVCR